MQFNYARKENYIQEVRPDLLAAFEKRDLPSANKRAPVQTRPAWVKSKRQKYLFWKGARGSCAPTSTKAQAANGTRSQNKKMPKSTQKSTQGKITSKEGRSWLQSVDATCAGNCGIDKTWRANKDAVKLGAFSQRFFHVGA